MSASQERSLNLITPSLTLSPHHEYIRLHRPLVHLRSIISMILCKTAVTPVHKQLSYCSLGLSHRYTHMHLETSASICYYKKNVHYRIPNWVLIPII